MEHISMRRSCFDRCLNTSPLEVERQEVLIGACQTRAAMIPLPVVSNVVKVLAGNGGLK